MKIKIIIIVLLLWAVTSTSMLHVIKGARIMSDKMIAILIIGLSGLILGIIVALAAKSRKNYKFSPALPEWAAAGLCPGILIGVAAQNIGAAGVPLGTQI